MDAGWKDKSGFVFVMAREDDVLNVAGHRLSSAALEEALLSHDDVVDAAVVAVKDDLKGELPLGLFVAREGSE
jgi:propionyl-CoA synthetase